MDLSTAETAYFLGLFWADGSLYEKKHRTMIEIAKDDLDSVNDIAFKVFSWSSDCSRKRKETWKETRTLSTSNVELFSFFEENGYKEKINPLKIINKIPEDLHYLWLRGYFDGDGCFYRNGNPNYAYQVCFAGRYEDDWTFLENFFEEIGIKKYKIKREINKKGHKNSVIRVTNKLDVVKLLSFIYKDRKEIGFPRKMNSYFSLVEDIKLHQGERNVKWVFGQVATGMGSTTLEKYPSKTGLPVKILHEKMTY